MLKNKLTLSTLLALAMTSVPSSFLPTIRADFSNSGLPAKRAKAKPKQGASNPLRGYYARYCNVLTEYITEQNARKQSQGKTGFKGFRKCRVVDKHGNTFWAPL